MRLTPILTIVIFSIKYISLDVFGAMGAATPRAENGKAKLIEGEEYLTVERYEDAVSAFSEAVSSVDPNVSALAQKKLHAALKLQADSSEALKWPICNWFYYYFPEIALITFIVVFLRLLYSAYDSSTFSKAENHEWKVAVRSPWTKDLPTDIFLTEFRIAAQEIAQLRQSLAATPPIGRITGMEGMGDRLVYQLQEGELLEGAKMSIQGIDIGLLLKMWNRVKQYFTWTLNLYVFKSTTISAYAVLQKRNKAVYTWRVPGYSEQHPADVRQAARALAYEILSDGWTKS